MSPLVFLALTDYRDRLPVTIRMDQIVAITTPPLIDQEWEQDEPHGGRLWLLGDLSFTVAESPEEILEKMHRAMTRIGEMS